MTRKELALELLRSGCTPWMVLGILHGFSNVDVKMLRKDKKP